MRRLLPLLVAVMPLLGGCGSSSDSDPGTTPSTLMIEDLTVGTGPTALAGDTVTVHYIGRLTNGQTFDNSYDRGQPYTFVLGANQVIPGFEQGVLGMKVGGKRRLTIPPSLAYGSQQNGVIPPNSTLIFEVDLIGVTR